MNLVDVVLVVALISATVSGFRTGFLTRVAGWIGVGIGALLALRVVPAVLDWITVEHPGARLLIAIVVTMATVAVTATIAGGIGARLMAVIRWGPLVGLDRLAGAIISVTAAAVLLWVVLPVAADVPGTLAQQVRQSAVVATADRIAPSPPDITAQLRVLVDPQGFPQVFTDLRPTPSSGAIPDEVTAPESVVNAAVAASARIVALGCEPVASGSAFVVDGGRLVTNAHVVAGATHVEVFFPDGQRHQGQVVVFDAQRDLAVVRVDGLERPGLTVAQQPQGDEGFVAGYPGGQREPRVAAVRFDGSTRAVGRDLYGASTTTRHVWLLAATLQRGDSGAPVVDEGGSVVAAVFAISPDRPDVAYALHAEEIQAVLAADEIVGEAGTCRRS